MHIFDMDGTLIDSNGIWREVDEAFLAKRGFPYTKEYYQGVAHTIFPLAAEFTKRYCHLEESVEDIMAEWMEMAGDAYATRVQVKPGVREYLDQCRRRGQRMMVLTSSVPAHCRAALGHLGLMPYFEEILFAHDLKIEKRGPGDLPGSGPTHGRGAGGVRGVRRLRGGVPWGQGSRDAHGGGLRSVLSRLVGGDDTGVRSDHPELHGAAGGLKKRNCRKKKQGRGQWMLPPPLWPLRTIKNENLPTVDRFTPYFTPYCNGSRRGHGAGPPGPRPPASPTDAGNCAG